MFGIEMFGIEMFILDKDIGKTLLNLMKYSLNAHFFCIGRGRIMAYMRIGRNRRVEINTYIFNMLCGFLSGKMFLKLALIANLSYFVR